MPAAIRAVRMASMATIYLATARVVELVIAGLRPWVVPAVCIRPVVESLTPYLHRAVPGRPPEWQDGGMRTAAAAIAAAIASAERLADRAVHLAGLALAPIAVADRKSTRLNSSP